jgi:hypothetical protein
MSRVNEVLNILMQMCYKYCIERAVVYIFFFPLSGPDREAVGGGSREEYNSETTLFKHPRHT